MLLKLLQCQSSHILFQELFCSTCLLTKERQTHQDFFPTLHHEESPEKPQYNMATLHFWTPPPHFASPLPPFSSKNVQTPSISINFEKINPPPFMKGGLNYEYPLAHNQRKRA